MADILRLSWENTVDHVDLLSGTLKLARGGYTPAAGPGPWVQDVISLVADDTAANIYDAVVDIEDRLRFARRWFEEPMQEQSVWLEYQSDGEDISGIQTVSRRALIRDGYLALDMPDRFRGGFVEAGIFAKLVLTRAHLFENQIYHTWGTTTQFDPMWGGQWALTSLSDQGNEPARLQIAELSGFSSHMDRAWLGIRSVREGISGFEHIWELEDGTAGADTSSGTVSGASGGDAMTCTFATTATNAERVSIELIDVVSSDYDHHVGRYLVLLRCQVGSGTSVAVRMRYGMRDNVVVAQEPVYSIDNTGWLLVELGEIMIPPNQYRSTASYLVGVSAFTIALEAERLSGSGNLILDSLCLVPSEHLFTIDMGDPSYNPKGVGYVLEDGSQLARVINASLPTIDPPFSMTNWHLPTDPGVAILQAQTATAHSLTANGDASFGYVPRWRMFRSR